MILFGSGNIADGGFANRTWKLLFYRSLDNNKVGAEMGWSSLNSQNYNVDSWNQKPFAEYQQNSENILPFMFFGVNQLIKGWAIKVDKIENCVENHLVMLVKFRQMTE